PSNCGQLDRQHNDDNGLDRSRSPGHPALRNRTQSKRRTNGQTQVNTSRIPWRMELLPCASADVKLVQVIYARALRLGTPSGSMPGLTLSLALALTPLPTLTLYLSLTLLLGAPRRKPLSAAAAAPPGPPASATFPLP